MSMKDDVMLYLFTLFGITLGHFETSKLNQGRNVIGALFQSILLEEEACVCVCV